MGRPLGLKNRLCPSCRTMATHRTVYARATVEGKRKWFPLFWACMECESLNHLVIQAYSLVRPPSAIHAASNGPLVKALEQGPLDRNQLLAMLRRSKALGPGHVFKSEVTVALEDLTTRGVVAEAPRDVTARVFESLTGRRLASCPRDAQRTLVRLHIRKKSPDDGARFVPAGVYCLGCGYHRFSW